MLKHVLCLGLMAVTAGSALASDKFPLRKEFPGVSTIELEQLSKEYADAIVVDVRSAFEFGVIHVEKASHVAFANPTLYGSLIEKVRPKEGDKKLVLYCNGVKCRKSFEAAEALQKAGWKNVHVMDAGVLAWGRAHPEKTFLLGRTPASASKIVSDEAFKAKLKKLDFFKKAQGDANVVFYDVRDPAQIKKKLDIGAMKYLALDKFNELLKKGMFKDKTLFIADAVGKQVEWLQYHLEENGYQNYWFLEGGVDGS